MRLLRRICCNKLLIRYNHAYQTSYCPSSELAQKLCDNLIYYKDGILVLNKPQGISFSQTQDGDTNEVSLKTCIPHIKKILKCSNLLNAKVPEKHISGVAIFCTDEETLVKIKGALRQMRELSIPQDEYHAVVLGKPLKDKNEYKGGIKLFQSSLSSKVKRVNFVSEWSKNAIKRREVVKVKIIHETLATSEDASLISVWSTINRWHCVRTYLSTQLLSPVLGDNLFGSRVKTLLGKPILVDIFSQASMAPQKIPQDVKIKLNIDKRNDIAVPLHLHLCRTTIQNFTKENLQFYAEPPLNFMWTCERLSLM